MYYHTLHPSSCNQTVHYQDDLDGVEEGEGEGDEDHEEGGEGQQVGAHIWGAR